MRVKRLRRATAVALVAAIAVGIAACGGNATSDEGKGAGGSTFKVMLMDGISSPTQAGSSPGASEAVKHAADVVNREGGLGGRPIKVVVCDSKGTEAGQGACARQAVQDGVDDAIHATPFSKASTPILSAAGIPQIGAIQAAEEDYTDRNVVPTIASAPSYNRCVPYLLKSLGVHKAAIFYLDIPVGKYLANFMVAAAKNAGVEIMKPIALPQTATDLAPYVLQARKSGADGTTAVTSPNQNMLLLRAKDQLGWDVPHVTQNYNSSDKILGQFPASLTDGYYACNALPSVHDENNPLAKRYNEEMDAAKIGSDRQQGAVFNDWIGIYALQALAKKQRADDPNSEITGKSLLKTAQSVKGADAINLLGGIKWAPGDAPPAGAPGPTTGTLYIQVAKGGHWLPATDIKPNPFDVWSAPSGLTRG